MKPAKPVSPAWSVLPLMESASLAYDKVNLIKRRRVCRRCSSEATVNGKRPKIPNGDLIFKQNCM